MTENEIGQLVRNAIYEVYFELGPGLLESTYEFALKFELESLGLNVKSQVILPLVYKGQIIDKSYRLDLLVEDKVIIEIKSVEELTKIHHKQLIGYLKLSNLKLGMLVNFNTDYLNSSIIRKVNNL
jgi:GxxExxY protein